MFEDIIKQKYSKSLQWDFNKYEKEPYCPSCGSKDITIIRDHLNSKRLTKEVRCNFCKQEWKEIWNKNIKLKLESCII